MKHKCKIWFLMMLVCLAVSGITAVAADERVGTVVDGSLLTDASEAEASVDTVARGAFLANGTGSLAITGSRQVKMEGSTTAYQTVNEVNVTLHLQRLEGNSWVHVYTLPTKSAYNTYYVSNAKTKSVTGGYYYRVYGAHVAIKGSSSEALTSCTNGIWVD